MGTLAATSPHSLILVFQIPPWPLVRKVRQSWGLRVAAEEQVAKLVSRAVNRWRGWDRGGGGGAKGWDSGQTSQVKLTGVYLLSLSSFPETRQQRCLPWKMGPGGKRPPALPVSPCRAEPRRTGGGVGGKAWLAPSLGPSGGLCPSLSGTARHCLQST